MFRKSVAALICSLALASVVAAQDAKTVLNNVSKAMGYDQLKSIEYSGSGFEGTAMGQAQSAAKGWPHFTVKNFTRYVDRQCRNRSANGNAFTSCRTGRSTCGRRRTRAYTLKRKIPR